MTQPLSATRPAEKITAHPFTHASNAPPDNPSLLNHFTQCCRELAASAVMKNIAGLMVGTGTGAVLGCPWVIGLLITAGVGTSWIGGLGIALIAVGATLWILSTTLSVNDDDVSDNVVLDVGAAALMGVAGIPYVIICAIANAMFRCCCATPAPLEETLEKIAVDYVGPLTGKQCRVFAAQYLDADLSNIKVTDADAPPPIPERLYQHVTGLDQAGKIDFASTYLRHSLRVKPPADPVRQPALLSRAQGQLISAAPSAFTAVAATSSTSKSDVLPTSPA